MTIESRPKAVDLTHHLSAVARSRVPSPLKDIIGYMAVPGMISLAGGLPHPSFFPLHSLTASAYPSSAVLDTDSGAPPEESLDFTVQRGPSKSRYALSSGLQYTGGDGSPALADFCRRLTARLWEPAYADWDVLLNGGGTDAWTKILTLLLEQGDYVITESSIYPSAQAAFVPLGGKALPIADDSQGMLADALEEALANWDESKGRRPRVMYTVPVGQNPLGTTMGARRRQEIYDVCVKYDVVIIEDDPYTMLQFEPYVVGSTPEPPAPKADVEGFLSTVIKSFLSIDVQGRVIRLDTYSKTLAPGARIGWFVANKMFIERLLRGTEVQTQMCSGFSSVIIGELLERWGVEGYLEWVTNLREQYRVRRDWMLAALATHFDLVPADEVDVPGAMGLVAYPKGQAKTGVPMLSFVPPVGGMFIWVRVHYNTHPEYAAFAADKEYPERAFEEVFWRKLNDALVLVTPGWYFSPFEGEGVHSVANGAPGGAPGVGGFRLAYSFELKPKMEEGIRRLAEVMIKEWVR